MPNNRSPGGLPKYLAIANSIRDRILDGSLRPGDEVPSERELATMWDVARPTASRALAELRRLGLVDSRVGAGSFVRSSGVHTAVDRLLQARSTGKAYDDHEHAEVLSAALIEAPDRVRLALALPEDELVIRRERVTRRTDAPSSWSTSWFRGSLAERAPKLLSTERIRQGTTAYVEERTNRLTRTSTDRFSARRASPREAELLGLGKGAPVLCGEHRLLDTRGKVVEFGESVAVAGSWTTTFERVVRA